eukprot:12592231-Heterocapsa_arctica.AAC.1
MKVSRDKTVMLASNGIARRHLKQAAGPELIHMISLGVKDLGGFHLGTPQKSHYPAQAHGA